MHPKAYKCSIIQKVYLEPCEKPFGACQLVICIDFIYLWKKNKMNMIKVECKKHSISWHWTLLSKVIFWLKKLLINLTLG